MGMPVVTVASGGLPVVDVTATTGRGMPVSEAANGKGTPVTKVASGSMAVVYSAVPDWPPPVASLVPTTWNPADKSANVTLSGSNLVATGSGGACGVRSVGSVNSGKYYWENTVTTYNTNNLGMGIGLASYVLTSALFSNAAVVTAPSGQIFINGASQATLGSFANATIYGIAVDMTAKRIWFRVAPSGNWNGSGTADPSTGVGGYDISSMSGAMYGLMIGSTSDKVTANFGASAFSGAVPSGFTSGLTV